MPYPATKTRFSLAVAAFSTLLFGFAPEAQATRRILVWYADGGVPPRHTRKICFGTPPPFQCGFGTVDECRQAVQALLDRWYADFDAIFTHVPPTDDGPYDTVIVSSSGVWCDADERTVSRSPLPGCTDMGTGSVALFACKDAKTCATVIAKEHAHIVGLQHTNSENDVMDDRTRGTHDGFEDYDNLSAAPRCGRTQNSYRLMRERLGSWPGGPKPEPGTQPPPNFDGAPPLPPVDAGVSDAREEDAVVAEPEVEAPVIDAAPTPVPDAPVVAPAAPKSDGGCGCDVGGAGDPARLWIVVAAAIGWLARRRR